MVGGIVLIVAGSIGVIVFPGDRAVRFPVTGAAIGWFLIAMGIVVTVVNFVKRERQPPPSGWRASQIRRPCRWAGADYGSDPRTRSERFITHLLKRF